MKSIRIGLACIAVAIASISVYANSLVVTVFYRSATTVTTVPSTATPSCFQAIATQGCLTNTGTICSIPADGDGNLYLVSKILDGETECKIARKTP